VADIGCTAAGVVEVGIDCIAVGVAAEVGTDIGCIAVGAVGDFVVLDGGLVDTGTANGVGDCSCHHRRCCCSQRCYCIAEAGVAVGVGGGCKGQVAVVDSVVGVRHIGCKKVVVGVEEGRPLVG